MSTYSEMFPAGTRIVVKAGKGEGTDQDWNSHEGTVLSVHGNQWAKIKMDKGKRHWPSKEIMIGCSNLQRS